MAFIDTIVSESINITAYAACSVCKHADEDRGDSTVMTWLAVTTRQLELDT